MADETQEVTLKPEAIEQKSKINPDGVGDKAVHLAPYQNVETQKIAEDRAKEQENAESAPYEYKANGYTVKEQEADFGVNATQVGDKFLQYVVEGPDDFVKVLASKADAENFCNTHSEAHAKMPATVPSN